MAHSAEDKARARELYQQHGSAYVADQLGIPERTVRRWHSPKAGSTE
jgi:transposase-like protein